MVEKQRKIICSLCKQEFFLDENPLIEFQKNRHQEWHQNCLIQKRNTIEGIVEWIEN